jgi:hypothetical protein
VVTCGQLFAPEVVNEYKLAMATTAKFYLMREYAGIYLPDYPSCQLTDAYGNLGETGLLLAGLAYGAALALVTRWLRIPASGNQLVAALIGLQIYTHFESDFISLNFLSWVQNAPVLIFLLLVTPVRVIRPLPTPRNRASPALARPAVLSLR